MNKFHKNILIVIVVTVSLLLIITNTNKEERMKLKIFQSISSSLRAELIIDGDVNYVINKSENDSFITNTVTSIKSNKVNDFKDFNDKENKVIRFISNNNNVIDSKLYFLDSKDASSIPDEFVNVLPMGENFIVIVEYKVFISNKLLLVKLSDSMIKELSKFSFN